VIEELAMDTIASGSVRVLNKNVVQSLRLSDKRLRRWPRPSSAR
jgi:predicted phosphoribosyltransferase